MFDKNSLKTRKIAKYTVVNKSYNIIQSLKPENFDIR